MTDLIQLFGVDWKLLVIQAVNFGVLLAALTYFLYRPILNVLDERRKKIEQGVLDAANAKKNLDAAQSEKNTIIGQATNEAGEIITKAKQAAEEKGKGIITDAEARSEKIESDAQLKAKEAAKRALDGSNKEIAQTAILAAERLLNKKLK